MARVERPVERLAYSVTEAAEALGVSRCSVYKLIHAEAFPVLKVGRRRLIPRRALEAWVMTGEVGNYAESNCGPQEARL